MPFPDALNTNPRPRIIFFTDFDGTITLQDTNDYITANYGCGAAKLREFTDLIATGKLSFRAGFQQEVDTWRMPFPRVLDILKSSIRIDPHFRAFVLWARAHHVPIIVLSSGMIPVIRTLLDHLLGVDLATDIEVIANDAQLHPPINSFDAPDGWTIKFHDDSDFGHDKSRAIRPYAEAIATSAGTTDEDKPTLLYAGDGVSDLSAARETDLLFAKAGKDLVHYCEREGIPFTTFEDWAGIMAETVEIWEGRKSVRRVAEEGLRRHRTNSLDGHGQAHQQQRDTVKQQAVAQQA